MHIITQTFDLVLVKAVCAQYFQVVDDLHAISSECPCLGSLPPPFQRKKKEEKKRKKDIFRADDRIRMMSVSRCSPVVRTRDPRRPS